MAEMEEDKFVGEVWRQRLGLGYELVEGGGVFPEARLCVGETQTVVLQDAVPDGGDHEQLLHAGGLK